MALLQVNPGRRSLLMLPWLWLGCIPIPSSNTADEKANERISEIHTDTRKALVHSTCLDKTRLLGPDCGLLSRGLTTPEMLAKFEKAHCTKRSPEECKATFLRMFSARLRERYFAADAAAVEHQCDLHPDACEDAAGRELLLLRSHNAHVIERGSRAELAVEQERAEANKRHADSVANALNIAFFLAYPGPKCVSKELPGTSTTLTECQEGKTPRR